MKIIVRCLAALFAIGLVAGSAYADQSYRITLGAASRIGNIELQPGEYKLVVDAPKVRFTHTDSGKTVELEAKIEETATKYTLTEIQSARAEGVNKIKEIRIGGSKTRIAFN